MAIDRFAGSYAFLSNFFRYPILIQGCVYDTVEHYFQSEKTLDPEWRERIRNAETPGKAKRLGRGCPLRPDWEEIKERKMLHALRVKFAAPIMRKMLLRTGDRELIEGNTWGDRYWGQVDGQGKNRLGQLLMQVRQEIREGKPVL